MMRLKTKINNFKSWREIGIFFAAFFCITFTFTSCKKKRSNVGKEALSQESIMGSEAVDTFSLKTYTVEEDSIFSMDPQFNLLGSYNDEVFGTVNAEFYTQLTLSGFSPDFGDLTTLTVDSAVMAFEYGGYYGDPNQQLFEVYELTEELTRDSSYVRTSSLTVSAQQLVPTANNEGLITPDPLNPTIVGNDTLDPQLRIPLDNAFAKNLLNLAQNANNDEEFLNTFKGLLFKTNNGMQAPGEGSVFYLASSKPKSRLTVYYTQGGDVGTYDFIITGNAIDFNHVDTDFTGTDVEQVINTPSLGSTEFYAQSFSTRAKIEMNSIDSLPKNIIIHKATLELPVSYYQGSNLYPSSEVTVSANLQGNDKKFLIDNAKSSYSFNTQKKAYLIDVRSYIQRIIQGDYPNSGIFVSPKKYNTTVERILFNGADTPNKKKPKLSIVYTIL